MRIARFEPAAMLDRALEYATQNLRFERILIQLGLDPSNITYDAIFNRVVDLALAGITFSNMLALIGGIFLIATFVVRTIVPMRVLTIVSIVFFLGSAVLAGSVPKFFLYLLALPINVIRLVQIKNLVNKARNSAQGTLSLDWLRPFMTPRSYRKGDVLFRKDDPATEMFLTVSGKFLVSEINIEIPEERILGELGFLSPDNHRTQSVECIEDGDLLAISYEKLREIYFQNPEFGYFFLRLTSDRLLQNFARLETVVEQNRVALEAANAAAAATKVESRGEPAQASATEARSVEAAPEKVEERPAAPAIRRPKANAIRRSVTAGNVIEMVPRPGAAAIPPAPPTAADIEAAQRLRQALAIVERHANYCAIGGFIPLPIANIAAITAVVVRMVRALGELYDAPLEGNRAYGVAIGLLGGVMPTRLASVATSTAATLVPGFNLVGLAVSSVTASAYARSIGRMLIAQFEHQADLERERAALKHIRGWRNMWGIRVRR